MLYGDLIKTIEEKADDGSLIVRRELYTNAQVSYFPCGCRNIRWLTNPWEKDAFSRIWTNELVKCDYHASISTLASIASKNRVRRETLKDMLESEKIALDTGRKIETETGFQDPKLWHDKEAWTARQLSIDEGKRSALAPKLKRGFCLECGKELPLLAKGKRRRKQLCDECKDKVANENKAAWAKKHRGVIFDVRHGIGTTKKKKVAPVALVQIPTAQ